MKPVWWHTPVIPACWIAEAEGCEFQTTLGNLVRPCLKIRLKPEAGGGGRTGVVAQLVEYFHSIPGALGSIPNT
jgi:hypothetical protein